MDTLYLTDGGRSSNMIITMESEIDTCGMVGRGTAETKTKKNQNQAVKLTETIIMLVEVQTCAFINL